VCLNQDTFVLGYCVLNLSNFYLFAFLLKQKVQLLVLDYIETISYIM